MTEWKVGDRVQARRAARGKVWIVVGVRQTVTRNGQLLQVHAESSPLERRSFRGSEVKSA